MYPRVYVEITNICNMRCSFCHGHKRPPRQMNVQEFSYVLDQLQGVTQYIYYHLMGEPLTHPLLPDFLAMAAQKGFRSVITTNGTLLDRHSHMLIAAGLHKINISVHSFEDGSEDSFYAYLKKTATFARKASQAGTIVSLRLWNKGHDGGRNEGILDYFHQQFPLAWTQNSRGFRIQDKLFLEWGDRFQWPDENGPDLGDCVTCRGMREHFGILCDGSVVPCCLDSEGAATLGNIFRQHIQDILNSDRAKAIAEGFAHRKASEDLCRRCGYARKF